MSVADTQSETSFHVPADICRDFERASHLEWLETNHTGGFAMGTVAGVNTRRYHGLLVAALDPPGGRYSILSRVEEQVSADGRIFELATAQYPGAVHPRGFELLDEFCIDPFPKWTYGLGSFQLTKTICLLDHQSAVLVRYASTQACQLKISPVLSHRDYHSLSHRNDGVSLSIHSQPDAVSFSLYPGLPALTLFHNGADFQPQSSWSLNNEYLRELDRGLDFREDLFSPGWLTFSLQPGRPAWFLASVGSEFEAARLDEIIAGEARRRTFRQPLHRALDQFRFTRFDGQPSLIAGYPWFTDWSRDTLISLPALTQAGFPDSEIKAILTLLLNQRSQGIVPNRFSDKQAVPEYNTADATLWLFVAAHDFVERTGDLLFLRDTLYPAAHDILDWHFRGTFYSIKVDPLDSLLSAGTPADQLTWMDAKIGDHVVTSRAGKAVELIALWYNALQITSRWAERLTLPQDAARFSAEAAKVRASFQAKFWNERLGCLYDVITPTSIAEEIRPNQLAAVFLPFPLLDPERARSVVKLVQGKLLTRVGLRTLDPDDPAYHARFEGDARSRDEAYHQGTAWPWLLGLFIRAYLAAFGKTADSVTFCRQLLAGMEQELSACCLGSLSEVYDGSDPQRPGGCPAQLWSVAQCIIVAQELDQAL
jgi:predicted glycogen debranching enzyme